MSLEKALVELKTEPWLVDVIMTRLNDYPYDNLVAAGMAMRLAAAQTTAPQAMLKRLLAGWRLDLSVYAHVLPAQREPLYQAVYACKDNLADDLRDAAAIPVSPKSWHSICERRDEVESCRVAMATWGDDGYVVYVAGLDEVGREARDMHADVVCDSEWLSCVSWQEPDAWWAAPRGESFRGGV